MPQNFLYSLPKAELHLHLEGTIEPATLVELSRRHDSAPLTLAQACAIYNYENFQGFLMAFKEVSLRLVTPEDYELVTYELMRRLHEQNVLHAEIYISVGVVHWKGQEFAPLFEGIERGRQRGEADFGVSVLWIFDAVRQFGLEAAERVFTLAAQCKDRNVVGIGIGGDELRGPAGDFRELYQRAASDGLRLTVHAGESAGPESIWAALNIGAERIGHGLTAFHDPELLHVLAEKQIPIEVCISSNLKTGCCGALAVHPVRSYFDEGLMVTLNSDDPAMFHTTLVGEYELARDHFGFTDEQLRELARNSFEASFLPAEKKLHFLALLDNHP